MKNVYLVFILNGKVVLYKGRPEIVVFDEQQIRIE
jgi:hypothetical protein